MIVKVCGMRDADNILALNKLGVDWIGFIFYQGSPRYVPDSDEFYDAVQTCTKTKAGVFVNEKTSEILRTFAKYKLNYVQLHGDETPDFCFRLRQAGCRIIKSFSISSESDLLQTEAYEPYSDFFLFDAKGCQRGGTGARFDWSILKAYGGNIPFLLS